MVPAVIGSCVANAHSANQFGDTMQETTNGLLTWTKATDVTEFTTGQKTWVLSGGDQAGLFSVTRRTFRVTYRSRTGVVQNPDA